METNSLTFTSIISSIQKIALYETKQNFYLIGTNNTQTRYRVLKIDRTEPKELIIHDDTVEYTRNEIHDLICMIEGSNRQRSGLGNVISAFGIIGFIRFLEGYYIILITKRQKVATIGHHTIYKIEQTTMIYLPHDSVRLLHPDETRYLKMFQSIDLSSNFYFSYSYDLTHTLQHNLSPPKRIIPHALDETEDMYKPSIEQLKTSLVNGRGKEREGNGNREGKINGAERSSFGIRSKPHRKFVWNSHLLKYVEKELHQDWILYVTHGFVGQSNMSVYGKSIYVTLIARRSAKYAGTRFLKRGANFNGDVANEVETEQVVHDSGVSSLSQCHITSFVQIRGSIPGHWRQEMGKMVAKPAITMDLFDPFAETAGAHFNELLKRYGAPIIVLNLVKQREKKKQESLLSEELSTAIKYLNQFLPQEYQIIYKTFDMARKNKSNVNVMEHLASLARNAVMKTGIFHNQPKYYSQKNNTVVGQSKSFTSRGSLQTGIVRTNCVDCLDRTNTAQFAIGKCVFGYQLCALGVIDSPKLEFDTDCVRMLECLYEDHGDTLALQYGGSQLVHRVKTYRKTAPWTSQGNDIMQTLSRYYSNTFSDADKQNTINLFLGVFVPDETKPQIWDYSTDYYFHHKININIDKSLTQWYDEDVLESLPYAYDDLAKPCSEIVQIHAEYAEMIDAYADFHRPYELTVLNETFSYKITNTIRDFMPNNTTNYSPFTVRVRPGRRREESSTKNSMKNPSLTGQSSTSSTTSSNSTSSSGSDSNSSEEESSVNTNESQMTVSRNSETNPITFSSLFPSMNETYGYELKKPNASDILLYKKYILVGGKANGTIRGKFTNTIQFDDTKISDDSVFNVRIPKVSDKSIAVYEDYIKTGIKGASNPSKKDMDIYNSYLSFK